MQELLAPIASTPVKPRGERRQSQRIDESLLVQISGVDEDGQAFQSVTLTDNLSAGGLFMRLARCLTPGMKLSVSVRFNANPSSDALAVTLTAIGEVLRAAMLPDGTCGVAVAFNEHSFEE